MTAVKSSLKFTLSRRNGVLFSALAAVLIFAAFLPPVESSDEELKTAPKSEIKLAEVSYHATADSIPSPNHWPNLNLSDALAVNPFAPILVTRSSQPSSQSANEGDPSTTLATAAKGQAHDNVEIIYENDRERVAVIGSRIVRVGDRVPEGRIIEIKAKEVILDVQDSNDTFGD